MKLIADVGIADLEKCTLYYNSGQSHPQNTVV
jgi:hypothetical protein